MIISITITQLSIWVGKFRGVVIPIAYVSHVSS